jgi:hypothetical protein
MKLYVSMGANVHIPVACVKAANAVGSYQRFGRTASIMSCPNNVGNKVPDYTVTSQKTTV